MGRRPAIALHLALSLIGAALYFVFVIPRWWVLLGDFPNTLATVGRIVAGLPIGLAAIPVALFLQQSLKREQKAPELALRLRAWSGVLHVVAGALIIVTAVAEIWLRLATAGPWLFAVYGAAGAITVLAVLAFYLSFVAEQPAPAPKPAREPKPAKQKKARGKRKAADESAEAETTATESDEAETTEETSTEEAAEPDEPAAESTLRNKRPTGKRGLRLKR